jgi:hypothetical protein
MTPSSALRRELEGAIRTITRVVRTMAPSTVSGDEARGMVDLLAEAERVVGSGIARLTPRVLETGSFAKAGHASGPEWLAAVSGSSAGAAKSRLAAAERAAVVPELAKELREGKLSAPQLKTLTDAQAAAPDSLLPLLGLVEAGGSMQELGDAAKRAKNTARCNESARVRRARVHAGRHFRWHQEESGGIRGEFFCDEVAWARVEPILEADVRARWKAAGSVAGPGEAESMAAHRLDAFLDLLAGSAGSAGSGSGARPHALVLVDAESLRRGSLTPGSTCEIEGIGPVSLEAANELLGEGNVQFVITHGKDILTVTSATRTPSQKTAMALIVRDRTCVVPGCGKRLGLQGDHCEVEYHEGGPTTLSNMVRLCAAHHDMKSHGGWRIEGESGNWRWVAPDVLPSAGRIARVRRVAHAKAKGRALGNKDRNGPPLRD